MASKKKAAKKAAPKKAAKKAAPKKASSRNYNKYRPKPKSGCYFTTACTQYYGLSDNCSQLMTLRAFRDNILLKTKNGKDLVTLYYKVAPIIVVKIENRINCELEFKNIFYHVNKSCKLINEGKNEEARREYINMVKHLIRKYL